MSLKKCLQWEFSQGTLACTLVTPVYGDMLWSDHTVSGGSNAGFGLVKSGSECQLYDSGQVTSLV